MCEREQKKMGSCAPEWGRCCAGVAELLSEAKGISTSFFRQNSNSTFLKHLFFGVEKYHQMWYTKKSIYI